MNSVKSWSNFKSLSRISVGFKCFTTNPSQSVFIPSPIVFAYCYFSGFFFLDFSLVTIVVDLNSVEIILYENARQTTFTANEWSNDRCYTFKFRELFKLEIACHHFSYLNRKYAIFTYLSVIVTWVSSKIDGCSRVRAKFSAFRNVYIWTVHLTF